MLIPDGLTAEGGSFQLVGGLSIHRHIFATRM